MAKSIFFSSSPLHTLFDQWGWFLDHSYHDVLILKMRKKHTICVLFPACFTWKNINYIVRTTAQVIGLNVIFSLSNERSKCFILLKCLHIWHHEWVWVYLCMVCNTMFSFQEVLPPLTMMPFKLSALLNTIVGTFLRTFPYSLFGVTKKCISDSIVLSFENNGWLVMLKTNLLSFVGLKVWILKMFLL